MDVGPGGELAVNVRHLQGKGFMESESQTIDGGEVDLIVEGVAACKSRRTSFTLRTAGDDVCFETKE